MSKQVTKGLRAVAGAAAAVTAATGLLTMAAPAQALPPAPLAPGDCAQWGFPGQVTINSLVRGATLKFVATGTQVAVPGEYNPGEINPDGILNSGTVTAQIGPGREPRIGIGYQDDNDVKPGFATFNGVVGAGGRAVGGNWSALEPMTCVTQEGSTQGGSAPKLGPKVTAKPGALGVTFTVTDLSLIASQCTYSSEGFTKSFGLPANGTVDVAVPAVRLFKDRTGTITCDNGTSTPTSVFY